MLSLGYIWLEFVRKLRVCWETAQPLPHVTVSQVKGRRPLQGSLEQQQQQQQQHQQQQRQQRSSMILDDSQLPQQGQGLDQQQEGQGLRLWERALWQDVIDSAGACRLRSHVLLDYRLYNMRLAYLLAFNLLVYPLHPLFPSFYKPSNILFYSPPSHPAPLSI